MILGSSTLMLHVNTQLQENLATRTLNPYKKQEESMSSLSQKDSYIKLFSTVVKEDPDKEMEETMLSSRRLKPVRLSHSCQRPTKQRNKLDVPKEESIANLSTANGNSSIESPLISSYS